MMRLDRPHLSESAKKNLKGKAGAPWKHGTREETGGLAETAYRDIRLEERFFLGNLTRGMQLRERRADGMRQYGATGAERERGREPNAFATMENEYGRVELGADKQKENLTIAVAQKVDADRKTLPNSAKRLEGLGATPVRGTVGERGKVLMANHNPRQSALAFKTQAKRGYRDALSLMQEIKRRGGSETIEETLPFLSTQEEVEAERELSEAMRGAETSGERNAVALRLNHIQRVRRLKEQRRKEFIRNLDLAIQRHRRGPGGGEGPARGGVAGLIERLAEAAADAVIGAIPGAGGEGTADGPVSE